MNTKTEPDKTRSVLDFNHGKPVTACRFDPLGRFAFYGSEDFRVWRIDWKGDAKTIAKIEYHGHESWVRALGFSPDGETFLTGGYDGRLVWWPAAAEKPTVIRSVDAHEGWIRALSVSPDGSLVATAGNDLLVKVWNLADGSLVHSLAGHPRYPYNVAFHPDGKALVSGDLMGNLYHWEVSSGKKIREFKSESLSKFDNGFKADIGGFRGLEFNSDGSVLAGSGITNVSNAFAGVGEPAVVRFDWESAKQTIQHESKGKLKGVAWNLALHPEGFTIAACGGSGGGFLLFWKPDGKEEFHQLKLPNTARDMHLCSDGLHLLTAHHDGRVRVWKMSAA
jgi:WD40 repeat protein